MPEHREVTDACLFSITRRAASAFVLSSSSPETPAGQLSSADDTAGTITSHHMDDVKREGDGVRGKHGRFSSQEAIHVAF